MSNNIRKRKLLGLCIVSAKAEPSMTVEQVQVILQIPARYGTDAVVPRQDIMTVNTLERAIERRKERLVDRRVDAEQVNEGQQHLIEIVATERVKIPGIRKERRFDDTFVQEIKDKNTYGRLLLSRERNQAYLDDRQ